MSFSTLISFFLGALLEEDVGVSLRLLPEAPRFPCRMSRERPPTRFFAAFVHRDDGGQLCSLLLFGFPLGLAFGGFLRQSCIIG